MVVVVRAWQPGTCLRSFEQYHIHVTSRRALCTRGHYVAHSIGLPGLNIVLMRTHRHCWKEFDRSQAPIRSPPPNSLPNATERDAAVTWDPAFVAGCSGLHRTSRWLRRSSARKTNLYVRLLVILPTGERLGLCA